MWADENSAGVLTSINVSATWRWSSSCSSPGSSEPGNGWFHNHVLEWSRDIHVSGLVTDLVEVTAVIAFGAGLVFGFTFDTTGPRRHVEPHTEERRGLFRRRRPVTTAAPTPDGRVADEPLTAERETVATDRSDDRTPVAATPRRTDDDS